MDELGLIRVQCQLCRPAQRIRSGQCCGEAGVLEQSPLELVALKWEWQGLVKKMHKKLEKLRSSVFTHPLLCIVPDDPAVCGRQAEPQARILRAKMSSREHQVMGAVMAGARTLHFD